MTTTQSNPTTMSDLDLVIQRQFDAPRELVFKAWTDPERLMHWWAMEGAAAPACSIDLRVDGSWRAAVVEPNGTQHWAHGRYVEIDAPERIVFTFNWEAAEDKHDTLVTVSLAEIDGRTTMTFHQATFRTVKERDEHNEGWSSCFDQLAAYLAA